MRWIDEIEVKIGGVPGKEGAEGVRAIVERMKVDA